MAKTGKLPISTAAANGGKDQGFSLIPQEKLLTLYSSMLKCRLLAQRAGHMASESAFELASGSEAAAAGITVGLDAEDIVIASPQDPLPGFIKGLPLGHTLGVGNSTNGAVADASTHAGSLDHPTWQVYFRPGGVAALLALATRVALTSKVRSTGQIVVVFCGDHPQKDESWEETLTFAGEKELPILFVCQERNRTNGASQRTASNGSVKERSFGVPAISVDGNDAVAVFRVASESISRARLGRGPTVVDCRSFRVVGKLAGSPQRTKPSNHGANEELIQRISEDAIANMEIYLSRKALFVEDHRHSVTAAFHAEIDAVLANTQVPPIMNA